MKDLEQRFEAGQWNPIEVTPAAGEKRKPTTPTKEAKKTKRDEETDDGAEGKENDARTSLVAEEKEAGKETEGKEGDARTPLVAEGKEVGKETEGKEDDARMKGKAKTKAKKGSTVAKGRRGALKDDGAGKKKAAAKVVKKKKEDGKILVVGRLPDTTQFSEVVPGCTVPQPVPITIQQLTTSTSQQHTCTIQQPTTQQHTIQQPVPTTVQQPVPATVQQPVPITTQQPTSQQPTIQQPVPTTVQQPVCTPQVISSPICGGDDIYTHLPNEDISGGSCLHDTDGSEKLDESDPLLLELDVMETRQQLEELQRQHTNLQSQHNEMKIKVEGMLGAQRLMEECLKELLCQLNTPGSATEDSTSPESFQTPPIQTPSIQAPPIQQPSIQAPPIQQPSIQAPPIQAPSIQAPPIQAPSIQAPPIQAPSIQAPPIQAPSIQAPPIQPPSIQAPPIQQPSIQAPPIQQPSIQAPTPSTSAPAHFQTPPQPLPPTRQNTAKCLDSCEIRKELLRPVDEVLFINAKYRVLSKASTLAVKLAKEAFFGDNVLVRCTVAGGREFPGLPQKEMQELKGVMLRQFPQFWQAPVQFELTWKDCCESIGQACKRLRDKNKNVQ
eukprot:Em0025g21a